MAKGKRNPTNGQHEKETTETLAESTSSEEEADPVEEVSPDPALPRAALLSIPRDS